MIALAWCHCHDDPASFMCYLPLVTKMSSFVLLFCALYVYTAGVIQTSPSLFYKHYHSELYYIKLITMLNLHETGVKRKDI